MEMEEHFYTDDPADGHPDVGTRIAGTEYFFLGNKFIHAAVQLCRSGAATPLGLIVMDPDRFGPKRAALSMNPGSGLAETVVGLRVEGELYHPNGDHLSGGWEESDGPPVVRVHWEAGNARVEERFSCPPSGEPCIVREVRVRYSESPPIPARLQAGSEVSESLAISLDESEDATATLFHEVKRLGEHPAVHHRWAEAGEAKAGEADFGDGFWNRLTRVRTSDAGLNHLFSSARYQLPAAVDHRGRMDGSIWQYNLEWVRDQSHVAEALVRLGDHSTARTMLSRLLDEFVSPEGDTVDSGQRRPAEDVELDQNGELLCALGTYVDWTGDLELVETRWERVRALASFPFQDRFFHQESGLLHNRREYWERHGGHGIRDGFELMSQFYVALGLERAAELAREIGEDEDGVRWAGTAGSLKRSLLEDPRFRLVENGHLIKRRGLDGEWQQTVEMPEGSGLPDTIPLLRDGPHLLDPDASSALLVAHEFIDPAGDLTRRTLSRLEELWNQEWTGGGYGRYNTSSEPDSPGAWPFASLFVARAYAEARQDDAVMRILRWLERTEGGKAGTWFENDGPRISPPYPQVGVTPWTWAEIITLFVHHFLGVRPHGSGLTLKPWLPAEVQEMEAVVPIRGNRLHLTVRQADSPEARYGVVEGERVPWTDQGAQLPNPTTDIRVEVFC